MPVHGSKSVRLDPFWGGTGFWVDFWPVLFTFKGKPRANLAGRICRWRLPDFSVFPPIGRKARLTQLSGNSIRHPSSTMQPSTIQ